jgi:Flp pilus assembly protein TadG
MQRKNKGQSVRTTRLRDFRQDQSGAAIVEFALVATVFFMLLLGIVEFGLFMFHKVALESIMMQAGREATLGKTRNTGNNSPCNNTGTRVEFIKCEVLRKAEGLINPNEVVINVNRVNSDNGLGGTGTYIPDICLDDPNLPSSTPATCTFYQDVNGTGAYEGADAAQDMGAAGELVEVRISYPWHIQVPFLKQFIGDMVTNPEGQVVRSGSIMITSATVVKNEPFE